MAETAEVYYEVEREVKVLSSPRSGAAISQTIPAEKTVRLLQRKHRWIRVEFLQEGKGDPQTGWLLKKYTKRVTK